MIKLYLHFRSLEAFDKGQPVVARTAFVGSDDIEVLLRLKNLVITYQAQGIVIRKKKWYEKLPLFSK